MEVSLPSSGAKHTLETVRALHETVWALKTAVEGSRRELSELRSRYRCGGHDRPVRGPMENGVKSAGNDGGVDRKAEDEEEEEEAEAGKHDSGAESEDIDDIELVFTTGETDPSSIQEDMVPIREEPTNAIVETDISKCGVVDETEVALLSRRKTAPDAVPYRPLIHREVLAAVRTARGSPRRIRPTAGDNAPRRQETGAQTDITALPAQWKSETYLAHKLPYNLTTLPSKFTLPVPPRTTRLPLSEKNRGARRVLLSDINFTSMVPELSRSADHLHQEEDPCGGYVARPEDAEYVKSCESDWEGKISREACESGRRGSRSSWGSRCQVSSTSVVAEEPRRRHTARTPPSCCHARCSWSSFGCHPMHRVHSDERWTCPNHAGKRTAPRRFCPSGASLPDLRPEIDSGDSTDSLIEEAEEFLRRSIDNMLLTRTCPKKVDRRYSESDSVAGFAPSQSAYPFLPKTPPDLKCDYLVKVITADGRIVVGRVRYSGHVTGKVEPYVGVELHTNIGACDGTFLDHRYFDCKPDHGIFVPFKKVVLAWCT